MRTGGKAVNCAEATKSAPVSRCSILLNHPRVSKQVNAL